MTSNDPIAQRREQLARRLKLLRVNAEMSGAELARRLEWSQSRISRIETARQTPTEAEVRAIAFELGVSSQGVKEMVAELKGLEQEWSLSRQFDAFGAQHYQVNILELEQSVPFILGFQQTVVPGLLQTAGYMRALSEVDGILPSPDDVDANAQVRLERQRVLKDKTKQFTFILTEAALWNRYGSGAVMHEQYEHLNELIDRKTVRLGIIPRTAKLPVLPFTDFTMFGDELVTIETITSEINLQHPHDIEQYRRIFDSLEAAAVSGKHAKRIIAEIDESYA